MGDEPPQGLNREARDLTCALKGSSSVLSSEWTWEGPGWEQGDLCVEDGRGSAGIPAEDSGGSVQGGGTRGTEKWSCSGVC